MRIPETYTLNPLFGRIYNHIQSTLLQCFDNLHISRKRPFNTYIRYEGKTILWIVFSKNVWFLQKIIWTFLSLSTRIFAFCIWHFPFPRNCRLFFYFFFAAVETKLERYKNDLKGNKEEEKKRESHWET